MAALPLGPLRSRVLLLVALVVLALSAPGFIAAFLWARCGWRGCLDVTRLAAHQPGGAPVVLDRDGEKIVELVLAERHE